MNLWIGDCLNGQNAERKRQIIVRTRMKKTIECECTFERLRPRIRFVPGQGIEASVHLFQIINCLCKGRKIARRKTIRQCQKCGKYSVECPYCHQNSVTTQLPDIIQCPHCGKVYQVRLFELQGMGIEDNSAKGDRDKYLRCVGPDKGGFWEVIVN